MDLFGQSIKNEHDLLQLKGRKVEIIELEKYKTIKFFKKSNPSKILFQERGFPAAAILDPGTIMDSLKGKVFTFLGSNFSNGNYILNFFNSKTDTIFVDNIDITRMPFKLILSNPTFEDNKNALCSEVEESYDKFNYTKTFSTPLGVYVENSYEPNPVLFYKSIKNQKNTYTIYLFIESISNSSGNGLIIILKNGKRIVKPNLRPDVSLGKMGYLGYYYNHSTSFNLSISEIELLKTQTITDISLGGISLEDINGEVYKSYLNCLLRCK